MDPARCVGHGRCYEICPQLFVEDEEGHASASSELVPESLWDAARRAEANCPERAIELADQPGL